ncbi:MAG: DUF86 domain-containing protein [Prevotellaceae bacterium]|nr:DUF86 domain-containing protein [Candidatus Faecinaster equi]
MVKNDKYYRDKLVEDVDFIIEHMAGETQESLETNPVLLDSMMFRLIQVSESAKNLSDEFKNEYSDIPWTAIYGLRNRIVHDYGNVKLVFSFS